MRIKTKDRELERKKRYLGWYKRNCMRLRQMEDQLVEFEARIESAKTASYSDMPRGGSPVLMDDLVVEKMELAQRIKELRRRNEKLKGEIQAKLDQMTDVGYRHILRRFFIDCKLMWEIADEIGYGERHTWRLYGKAIEEIDV